MTRWTITPALACLAILLLAHPAPAQDAVKALETALKGKQMELRNYSADKTARYEWSDGKLVEAPVEIHTLAVFVTQSVKLKHGIVSINGQRSTLARNPKDITLGLYGNVPMTLEVDLKGADPAVVIPQLPYKLFFSDAKEAVASLPAQIKICLDLTANSPQKEEPSIIAYENGSWIKLKVGPLVIGLVVVSAPSPKYPEAVREARVSGVVVYAVNISDTGKVKDPWLVRPLGYGLDEEALDAIKAYVFKPAQHNGHFVGAEVMIDTNFQIPSQ